MVISEYVYLLCLQISMNVLVVTTVMPGRVLGYVPILLEDTIAPALLATLLQLMVGAATVRYFMYSVLYHT